MKIFDFHTHVYPPTHAQKAMSIIPKDSPFGPFYDGTLEGLIVSNKRCGVDKALTLHIANQAAFIEKVNDWAIYCNSVPNIYAFGSLHPDYKDIKKEIKRLKAHGIKGLKFHPYYQKFDVDDKAMYHIYEAAASEDMIMLFHTGTDLRHLGDYCMPKKFNRFCDDFKDAKIVGAHLGGMLVFDEAFDLMLGKSMYLDTSFAFRYLNENQKKKLLTEHDHKKILFGTDAPWVDAKDDIEQLEKYLSEESRKLIFYDNAIKLLGDK
ncbi:MAG: amidohydrolase family protein [Firmicutes bacterium]|nr:amidohydrolase family protein [Bacillota bacterium]